MRAVGPLLGGTIIMLLAGCGPSSTREEVLYPVPADPTVTFKVWFRVGSNDDPVGKEGLAHLTGRMLAEGATETRSYQQILEALYPLASSYGVRVDKQMTVFTGRTHRDNLDTFLELFGEALTRPAFDAADLERHRSNALNYVQKTLRYASDEELGKAVLYATVFEGTGFEHPPEGTETGVESISLDDVRSFHRRHFARANATLALGGSYDDGVLRKFRGVLDALPEGPADVPSSPAPVLPSPERNRIVLVEKDGADASISFGFPVGVRRGDREFYALWLAVSWLGEHRNSFSHLYQTIREARGMNYGDYAYIEAFPEGGRRQKPPVHVARDRQLFEVWIRTLPNENAHFAIRAALREIRRLVDEGLTEEEFELTREFLSNYILHYATTTSDRLGYAVDDRFYGIEGEGHLARFRELVASLSRDEVHAAVRKHLKAPGTIFAIVTGDAAALKASLVSGAASPPVYDTPKDERVLATDREIERFPFEVSEQDVRVIAVDEVLRASKRAG